MRQSDAEYHNGEIEEGPGEGVAQVCYLKGNRDKIIKRDHRVKVSSLSPQEVFVEADIEFTFFNLRPNIRHLGH